MAGIGKDSTEPEKGGASKAFRYAKIGAGCLLAGAVSIGGIFLGDEQAEAAGHIVTAGKSALGDKSETPEILQGGFFANKASGLVYNGIGLNRDAMSSKEALACSVLEMGGMIGISLTGLGAGVRVVQAAAKGSAIAKGVVATVGGSFAASGAINDSSTGIEVLRNSTNSAWTTTFSGAKPDALDLRM